MKLRRTGIIELQNLFSSLGVKKGETVMCHSSVLSFGIVENGIKGIYRALFNIIGEEGTLIVPTFTYSFRRNQVFDIKNTPSPKALGAFSEHIRNMPEAIRSADPLFSMAAVGADAEYLMKRESYNCFGKGSIYEKLFKKNMLILGLGITYSAGISAFMHLEKLAGVDYRIDLKCSGTSIGYNGIPYDDYAIHFARDEENYADFYADRDIIGKDMEKAGVSKSIKFGSGNHIALKAKNFEEYILERLKTDLHAMLFNNEESL